MANTLLRERMDDILILTLNRPDRGNALDAGLVEALSDAIESGVGEGYRLITIAGEGRHFCTGFDFGDLDRASDGDLLLRFVRLERLLQLIHFSPVSVLALAKGGAIGAGADLFCAAQHRIAAPGTSFRMPGWRFGIALGTRRFAERVGGDMARVLLADARTFDAELGRTIGLVGEILPEADWATAVAEAHRCAGALAIESAPLLHRLTRADNGDADMAALVESASRPGLRERMWLYREAEKAARQG